LYAGDGAETVTHVATPNEAQGLTQTFYLQDYATTLLFRNLELSATTYDFNEVGTAADSDIQNVILGRDVIVRGVNNICIGNRFSTSGANSIILGNDIGVLVTTSDTGVGQINDIYESIIIGNNCYQNSLVRNIISIGRNVLNDLYLSPLAEVNAFLSQSPIIIGNSVVFGLSSKFGEHVPSYGRGRSADLLGCPERGRCDRVHEQSAVSGDRGGCRRDRGGPARQRRHRHRGTR
jgi:hypothetical protein